MAIQKSFLSPLGYQLSINKIPNTTLNVVSATVPGVNVEDTEVQTPFKIVRYPDKLVYNDFVVRFKVDENMTNYIEIYNWMNQIGRPEEFAPQNLNALFPNDVYSNYVSDGTLTILDSVMKPNIEIRFKDLFPVVLSDLEFTSQETNVTYVDATVTFRLLSFTVHVL